MSSAVRAPAGAGEPVRTRLHRVAADHAAPLHRLVWLGLAAYALLLLVLTVTAVNGTSAGALYADFFSGADPRLLVGQPRGIRSDEWLVQTPLTLSQVEQGLPRFSELVPGAMDMSVVWDVPYREWSVAFRPQMWGFFVLPLDQAFAYKWWLPAICLGAAAYALAVTLWRRPVAAMAVSLAFVFSGFVQWWYHPITLWPLTFALVVATCTVWMLRSGSGWVRLALALVSGYAATVAVVALYPAFLVPCVLVTAAFCVGATLSADLPWAERVRRLVPLLAAGVVSGVIAGVYLLTRLETVRAVLSTVYPGQRLGATGDRAGFPDQSVWAGVFAQGLTGPDLSGFATNASEGSSFLFTGFFLVPSALWLLARTWRTRRTVDWLLLALGACTALLLAYVYVPGWDAVAHLLLLDRTTASRVVVGLGLASFLLLLVVVHRIGEAGRPGPWWTVVAAVALLVLPHAVLLGRLRRNASAYLDSIPWWPLLLVGLAVAVVLYARGRRTVPSVLLLAVSLAVSGTVNPLYRGVLDLRTSDLGQAVERIDDAEPGAWISVGDHRPGAVLRETAVESYSGIQAWPSDEMWDEIDPDGSSEPLWNRYAHVYWHVDPAGPEMVSPIPDQVFVAFDACSDFVQENVSYVVAQGDLNQPCLRPIETVVEDSATYRIFAVAPAG